MQWVLSRKGAQACTCGVPSQGAWLGWASRAGSCGGWGKMAKAGSVAGCPSSASTGSSTHLQEAGRRWACGSIPSAPLGVSTFAALSSWVPSSGSSLQAVSGGAMKKNKHLVKIKVLGMVWEPVCEGMLSGPMGGGHIGLAPQVAGVCLEQPVPTPRALPGDQLDSGCPSNPGLGASLGLCAS